MFFSDRKCDDWEGWNHNFTPQWHLEQRRMKDLTQMQIDNNQKLAQMQIDNNQKLAQMQQRSDRRTALLFLWWTLIAIVLAVGQIAYPNGATGIHFPYEREEQTAATPTPISTTAPTPESR